MDVGYSMCASFMKRKEQSEMNEGWVAYWFLHAINKNNNLKLKTR